MNDETEQPADPVLLQLLAKMPPDALIKRSLELKAYVEGENKRFTAHMKPANDERAAIANELLARMNQQGLTNVKTEYGTAYLSTLLNQKVFDRDAFLKECLENWTNFGGAMVLVSAQQDSVKEYMESHEGNPPPGITVSWFTRLNIRKG
jgi:hypothetical protein